MHKKPFSTALILCAVVILVSYSVVVNAQSVLVSDWINNSWSGMGDHGAYPNRDSELGNCFTTPTDTSKTYTLVDAMFALDTPTGPVSPPAGGVVEALLFNTTGSLTNDVCAPTGNPLGVSTNTIAIEANTVGNLTFRFSGGVAMQSGTVYGISLRLLSCTVCYPPRINPVYPHNLIPGAFWGVGSDNGNGPAGTSFYVADGSGGFIQLPAASGVILSFQIDVHGMVH